MNSDNTLRTRRWKFGWSAAGLLAAGATFGFLGSPTQGFFFPKADEQPPAAVHSANDLSVAFRYASDKVMPSLVTIRSLPAEMKHAAAAPGDDLADQLPPEFRRFFGENGPKLMPRQGPRAPQGEGMGSGVIIDEKGIILTNNHVVQGGKIIVRLHDGREFPAVEVKTDPKTDMAVVRIEGAGTLKAAYLADSDKVQIGDWVLAVGAPFDLKETVTAGIISAKSRGIGISEREDYLQTDAAINPGNSGGPLVNLRGEVVGINTAISSRSGGNEGIGFSVPANTARWISQQLIKDGAVKRAMLGVGIQPVTVELSREFNLKAIQGAVVTEIKPGSAAAKAGLESGDVIVEFDKKAVESPRDLQNLVERAAADQTHEVAVMRNGEKKNFAVTLQTMTEQQKGIHAKNGAAQDAGLDKYGMEVSALTNDVARQLGMEGTQGVVITGVKPGSAAEQAGLREGMIIARVGQKPIKTMDDFNAAMKASKANTGLMLLVRTPQGSQFLMLKNS